MSLASNPHTIADIISDRDVVEEYQQAGISELLCWQWECLSLPGVLDGHQSLVYSAPTSSGKSLVAEIICIRRILRYRTAKAIFVLPFISLAREKMLHLQRICRPAGIRVEGYISSTSPVGGLESWDIAVCTIEKCNAMINRLIETDRLDLIRTLVVDELHTIGEAGRGYVLELLITKMKFLTHKKDVCGDQDTLTDHSSDGNCGKLKIIGMSATLPNLHDLAFWLDARLYVTDYRPIPLVSFIKVDTQLFDSSMVSVKLLENKFNFPNDTDNIAGLCCETLLTGNGCLIFCSTRSWCEKLCENIAKSLLSILRNTQHFLCQELREAFASIADYQLFIDDFKSLLPGCQEMDPILKKTLPVGVAYHHAGLTAEEREMIERGFRAKVVKVLVATTTLSSGVNLPARRVIVRSPWGIPGKPGPCLTSTVYRQMIGRAGRKGYDTIGESILVCKKTELERGRDIVCSKLQPLVSGLIHSEHKLNRSIKKVVLESIANGMVSTEAELEQFLRSTLCFKQLSTDSATSAVSKVEFEMGTLPDITDCLEFLIENEFITRSVAVDESPLFQPTQLGLAALSSSLTPDEALFVFRDLQKAMTHLVLESELHLIYLVTPIHLVDSWGSGTLNWYNFYQIYCSLPPGLRTVATVVGISEAFLSRAAHGQLPSSGSSAKEKTAALEFVHRRFYTALALLDLIEEMPLADAARKFHCNRGFLQSLQNQSSTYCGMITAFCDSLGWVHLKSCLSGLGERLLFGVRRDLTQIVRIDGLDGSRARVFCNNGLSTIGSIAKSSKRELISLLRKAVPFHSSVTQRGRHREASDGLSLNAWLAGHPEMTEDSAADLLLNRAVMLLAEDMKAFGLDLLSPAYHGSSDLQKVRSIDLQKNMQSLLIPQNVGVAVPLPNAMINSSSHGAAPDNRVVNQNALDSENILNGRVSDSDSTAPLPDLVPDDVHSDSGISTASGTNGALVVDFVSREISDLDSTVKNDGHVGINERSEQMAPVSSLPCSEASDNNDLANKTADWLKGVSLVEPDPDDSLAMFLDSFEKEQELASPKNEANNVCPEDADLFDLIDEEVVAPLVEGCFSSNSFRGEDTILDLLSQSLHEDLACKPGVSCEVSASTSYFYPTLFGSDVDSPTTSRNAHAPVTVALSKQILKHQRSSQKRCRRSRSNSSVRKKIKPTQVEISMDSSDTFADYFDNDCVPSSQPSTSKASVVCSLPPAASISSLKGSCESYLDFCGNKLGVRWWCDEELIRQLFSRIPMDSGNIFISLSRSLKPNDSSIDAGCTQLVLFFDFNSDPIIHVINADLLLSRSSLKSLIVKLLISNNIVAWNLLGLARFFRRFVDNFDSSALPQFPCAKQFCFKTALWLLAPDADDYVPKCLLDRFGHLLNKYPKLSLSDQALPVIMSETYTLLKSELSQKDLLRPFIETEIPVIGIIFAMEINGIGFDFDGCSSLDNHLRKSLRRLEKKAQSLLGRPLAFNNPRDVSKALFAELKLPPDGDPRVVVGDAGSRLKSRSCYSTAKSVLKNLLTLHPLPGLVLEWRTIHNAIATGTAPLMQFSKRRRSFDFGCSTNDRIFGKFDFFTATGRMIMRSPSLQILPKEVSVALDSQTSILADPNVESASYVSIRRLFRAAPGYCLLSADYSQVELRVLAHLSNDPSLRHIFMSGQDIFRQIASAIKGNCPISQITDADRQHAKGICYGIIYGMGTVALSESLSVSETEARKFSQNFRLAFPQLGVWSQKIVEDCRLRGFVTTLAGRRRYLPDILSASPSRRAQAERQAVNTTVQGSAADLFKAGLLRMEKELKMCVIPDSKVPARFVMQMHDEVLLEVKSDMLSKIGTMLKKSLESAYELRVGTPVRLKSGNTWGSLEDVHID